MEIEMLTHRLSQQSLEEKNQGKLSITSKNNDGANPIIQGNINLAGTGSDPQMQKKDEQRSQKD